MAILCMIYFSVNNFFQMKVIFSLTLSLKIDFQIIIFTVFVLKTSNQFHVCNCFDKKKPMENVILHELS